MESNGVGVGVGVFFYVEVLMVKYISVSATLSTLRTFLKMSVLLHKSTKS